MAIAESQTPESSLPESDSGFANRVRSAVIWRWGSQVTSQIITWTTTILVVRLLDPQDYGLFAMSQAVLTAFNFLNGYSFASSLIQAKDVDKRRIGQVFGLLILSNFLLASAQLIVAPMAALYYGQPMIADMLRIQALVYLTTPFIALPSALLARGLSFRTQALVNFATAVTSAGTALYLAAKGYGVWALIWAPIVGFSVRAIGLTVAAGEVVKPVFDFRGARDIIGFGSALTLCQLFWIIQSQSDIVIAGRQFTPHNLGLYSEALFLTLIFTGRFLPPLNEVAFPAFASLTHEGKSLAPAFISGTRLTMLIAAPFYVGLALVAGPLVKTFFGPKWLEMVPIVSGLAIVMPVMALQIICAPATNALGKPSIYVRSSMAGAIIMPICYSFGIGMGPQGLVTAWHIAAPLLLAVTLYLTLPAIGAKLGDLVSAMLPVAAGCAAMAIVVRGAGLLIVGLPPIAQLGIAALVGMASYTATIWVFWPKLLKETLAKLRKR